MAAIVCDCYTGDSLKRYIDAMGIPSLKERDFVKGIGDHDRRNSFYGLQRPAGCAFKLFRKNLYFY